MKMFGNFENFENVIFTFFEKVSFFTVFVIRMS
jgi:hypothetical protein